MSTKPFILAVFNMLKEGSKLTQWTAVDDVAIGILESNPALLDSLVAYIDALWQGRQASFDPQPFTAAAIDMGQLMQIIMLVIELLNKFFKKP